MTDIPVAARSEKAEPIMQCVEHAAMMMGCSPDRVAKTMNDFLDEVARLVAGGSVVRIPCFGVFAQQMGAGQEAGTEVPYPAFSAARPWRNELYYDRPITPDEASLGHNSRPDVEPAGPDWRERRMRAMARSHRPRTHRPLEPFTLPR